MPAPRPVLRCTYRVQLHAGFTFDDAAAIVPYLAELGVSHLYTSPILQAAAGSTHGYDVVDHAHLNAELGGDEAYERLQDALRAHDMGHVLDIVPNHMAQAGRSNAWWWDVLENGPASRHAAAFDIDWRAGAGGSAGRVLVPVLGNQIGRVLEAGELSVERDGGSFTVRYFDHEVPVSPRSLDDLLAAAAERAGSDQLASIATAHGHLPSAYDTEPTAVAERHRDKELLRERLAELAAADASVAAAIDTETARLSADPDELDALLQRQNYRLAYWRTAREELDYRRFFNIETLVGVRVEDLDVFAATHARIAELVAAGDVDELRVDHIDGLRDPEQYLERLEELGVPVVVEKILAADEELPLGWAMAGTTGYEFAHRVDGLFVDASQEAAMAAAYTAFVGDETPYPPQVRAAKQQVMRDELRAEVERLTGALAAICQNHRRHRDHTHHDLREALREVLAAFPVYRTYVREGHPTAASDRDRIATATRRAGEVRPDIDAELLSFLTGLLCGDLHGAGEQELAVSFQQVSAPVMAKGVEDTVFYRYNRLVSLNEVGGDPSRYGVDPGAFHAATAAGGARHPAAMLTLSTHDTKRAADVRARIHLLSEIPGAWGEAAACWHDLTARHRSPAGPDPATEWLTYQTLVGAWPIDAGRLGAYLEKATKEAKVETSWTDPDPAYDAAVRAFAEGIVADAAVVGAVESFLAAHRLVELGRVNSVAQTALLLTSPGVPDVYQGTEMWDLSLVDPDNRRPVDYASRRAVLDRLGASGPPAGTVAVDDDGATKLWLVHRVLADRARRPEAYADPTYEPLAADGPKAAHVVAFARRDTVVVVPRLVLGLGGAWGATTVRLPAGEWNDALTGATWSGRRQLQDLLGGFPVAVLARSG